MTSPEDRRETEKLAHDVGRALQEINNSTNPVIGLFNGL